MSVKLSDLIWSLKAKRPISLTCSEPHDTLVDSLICLYKKRGTTMFLTESGHVIIKMLL